MKNYGFDKSSLSIELQEKQKAKGTFDSPCLSVCNYDKSGQCQTCMMFQAEKQQWKISSDEEKNLLANTFKARKNNKNS